MSRKISIKGHGASITIEVLDYERHSTQDELDANWLKCHVVVDLGHFTGNYNASFSTSDFVRFRDGLKKLLISVSGSASFLSNEEALNCTIEMRKTGIALIKGIVQVHGQMTISLSFSFESDQSFLSESLAEIETVLGEFPVK